MKMTVKRFRMRDLQIPANVLIVGPSASRKNAAILRIGDALQPQSPVIVSSHPELYEKDQHVYSTDFPSKAVIGVSDFCVFEDLPEPDFSLFDAKRRVTTIMSLPDYSIAMPRSAVSSVDYVLLFGGIKHLRRVWDDFGMLIPQFRDFRQIYLASTDEGDRYCDDFMLIRVGLGENKSYDPEQVFFWSSLRRDPLKTITLDFDDNNANAAANANAATEVERKPTKTRQATPLRSHHHQRGNGAPRTSRKQAQAPKQQVEEQTEEQSPEEQAPEDQAEEQSPEEQAPEEQAEQQAEECCIL